MGLKLSLEPGTLTNGAQEALTTARSPVIGRLQGGPRTLSGGVRVFRNSSIRPPGLGSNAHHHSTAWGQGTKPDNQRPSLPRASFAYSRTRVAGNTSPSTNAITHRWTRDTAFESPSSGSLFEGRHLRPFYSVFVPMVVNKRRFPCQTLAKANSQVLML